MLDDDLLDALCSIAHRGFLIYWPGSHVVVSATVRAQRLGSVW
jgi:hypothetical protein